MRTVLRIRPRADHLTFSPYLKKGDFSDETLVENQLFYSSGRDAFEGLGRRYVDEVAAALQRGMPIMNALQEFKKFSNSDWADENFDKLAKELSEKGEVLVKPRSGEPFVVTLAQKEDREGGKGFLLQASLVSDRSQKSGLRLFCCKRQRSYRRYKRDRFVARCRFSSAAALPKDKPGCAYLVGCCIGAFGKSAKDHR